MAGAYGISFGNTRAFTTGLNGVGSDLGTLAAITVWLMVSTMLGKWWDRQKRPGVLTIPSSLLSGRACWISIHWLICQEGVILINAIDINNNGQIIVMGVVPEPEAYALMLAGLGLIGPYGATQESGKSGMNKSAF